VSGRARNALKNLRADEDAGHAGGKHEAQRAPVHQPARHLHRHHHQLDGRRINQRRADGQRRRNMQKQDEQRRDDGACAHTGDGDERGNGETEG